MGACNRLVNPFIGLHHEVESNNKALLRLSFKDKRIVKFF